MTTECTAPLTRDCSVIELRQYMLHPGQRDALIELFDREFVETQEAVGMRVIGQFRDLGRPDLRSQFRLRHGTRCPGCRHGELAGQEEIPPVSVLDGYLLAGLAEPLHIFH